MPKGFQGEARAADDQRPQVQKFPDLARELECDDDEAAFDERLKKLAGAKPKAKGSWQVRPAKVGNGHIPWFIPDGYGPTIEGPNFPTEAEARAWVLTQ